MTVVLGDVDNLFPASEYNSTATWMRCKVSVPAFVGRGPGVSHRPRPAGHSSTEDTANGYNNHTYIRARQHQL
jgi:hypothetical protein